MNALDQVKGYAPSVRRLYEYGLREGEVRLSETRIADELGLTRNTITTARQVLMALGLVENHGTIGVGGRRSCWVFLPAPRP